MNFIIIVLQIYKFLNEFIQGMFFCFIVLLLCMFSHAVKVSNGREILSMLGNNAKIGSCYAKRKNQLSCKAQNHLNFKSGYVQNR